MRTLARTLSALLLAALVALVPATAASAAKKPKAAAAWAKKHRLSGSWKAKDADKDGLKNLAEFKAKTNPRKADSDKDGLKDGDEVSSANNPRDRDTDDDGTKDGDEHAGVVTAFDGDTITIKQFKGGTLTAYVDDSCDDVSADDSSFDDEFSDDDGFVDTDEGEWEDFGDELKLAAVGEDDEETDLDLDEEADEGSCDLTDVEEGDVLTSAELEDRDGEDYVVALEIA